MKALYTATFETDETGTFYARVPDLPGCITTGRDLEDAIDLITDAANLWLVAAEDHGDPIPSPTPQHELHCPDAVALTFIAVDTLAYRASIDSKAVRKSVSLPAWMAALADQRGINCSQVLQDGLMEKFA
ncbi:MAG: type II toxin-antitoxin system HicB family antitoxin [Lachnospiraceae bacterium]|nr:type II toxin-antitoxin system HicB family antitoxin [Lachnospiraceae bacterium]